MQATHSYYRVQKIKKSICDPCKESYTLVRKLHTNWMQSYFLYSVFWPPFFLFPNQIAQFGVSMLTFPVSNEGSGPFFMFTVTFYYSMRTLLLVLLSLSSSCAFPDSILTLLYPFPAAVNTDPECSPLWLVFNCNLSM